MAEEAERNLNTYEAKTGANKTPRNSEVGVELGVGGPEHKLGQQLRDYGGSNKSNSTSRRRSDIGSKSATDDPAGAYSREVMTEGRQAAQSNMEGNRYVAHKGQYPGAEYYNPQEVPGEMSAEGYEAPESVTEASRESERYNR